MKIKYDVEKQAIYIDDSDIFAPTEMLRFLHNNTMLDDWKDFKFVDFKNPDYTNLMQFYRDCGINWIGYIHFANAGIEWKREYKRRGKIVVGELAKNLYIFYTAYHKTEIQDSLRTTKRVQKSEYIREFHYPAKEHGSPWNYQSLNTNKRTGKLLISELNSWRNFLKDQYLNNAHNLSSDTASKLSALIIQDL